MSTPSPTSPPSTNSTAPPPTAPPPVVPPPTTTPAVPPPTTTPVVPPPTTTPAVPPPTTTPAVPPPTTPSESPPAPSTPSGTPPSSSPPSSSPPPPAGTTPTPRTPGTRASPPPPPPAIGKSPPRAPSSSNTSSPPDSGGGGISTSLVIGVAIGGVAVLVVFTLLFICCKKKKKKRRDQYPVDYYGGGPPPPKEGYGGQPQQWSYNVPPPPPADHVISIPPKLNPPPGRQQSLSSMGSVQPPPPPPPFISSGDSGSNYSEYESPHPPPPPPMSWGFSKSTFTYEELARATDGFSDYNLLGQGGFGYVHKGILPNGKEVAVKHLKLGSGQGEREFQAEVEIISRVHHKHLVSLVGYCSTGSQRMLVYEFVPNSTMEFHLHGKGRPTMDWATRLKIGLGSAKGLAYLHEDCHPKIIHRDIKAANILLDAKYEAKVADFGLAKFSSDTNTHVSTRVMGTFGYLAPEYAASGKLSEKSDVFSFGVMLLELITGRRPVDSNNSFTEDSLVDWARPLLQRALEDDSDEAYDILVDQHLQSYNHNEMKRMVACAAAAVRHSARRRPQMSQIVRALEGDASLSDLNEGMKPGHRSTYSSHESSDYDTFQYNEDMKKFRKTALNSTEYTSTEYSAPPTSEYGLNPSGSSSEGQQTGEMSRRTTKKDSQGF